MCPCTKSQCHGTVYEEVTAINVSLEFCHLYAVCCCLQTCKCGCDNEVMWCTHVPSCNVMG